MTKTCTTCRAEKPISDFGVNRHNPDGFQYCCKPCANEKGRAWRKANPEYVRAKALAWQAANPEKVKASQRRVKYGLDEATYQALLASQENECAICRTATKLVVDHDHVGGRVRGLLCSPCNLALGIVKDDPGRLSNMIRYLNFDRVGSVT